MTVPGGQDVKPGAQTKVQVRIQSAGLRGKVHKDIFIVTNDPASPTVKITLSGEVREVLALRPAYVNFGTLRRGKAAVRELALTNQGAVPVVITGMEARPERLFSVDATTPLTLGPGETRTLKISCSADTSDERAYGTVIMRATQKQQPLMVSVSLHALIEEASPTGARE